MWKDTEDDNQLAILDEDERGLEKESEEEQMVRQLEEECQELALVYEAAVDEADDVIELVPVPPPAKKSRHRHFSSRVSSGGGKQRGTCRKGLSKIGKVTQSDHCC